MESRYCSLVSLNPYSNGILPDKTKLIVKIMENCLNPYSNGILPDTNLSDLPAEGYIVLILILMEYSLTAA